MTRHSAGSHAHDVPTRRAVRASPFAVAEKEVRQQADEEVRPLPGCAMRNRRQDRELRIRHGFIHRRRDAHWEERVAITVHHECRLRDRRQVRHGKRQIILSIEHGLQPGEAADASDPPRASRRGAAASARARPDRPAIRPCAVGGTHSSEHPR